MTRETPPTEQTSENITTHNEDVVLKHNLSKTMAPTPTSAHQRQWFPALLCASLIATASAFSLRPTQLGTCRQGSHVECQSTGTRSIFVSPRLPSRMKSSFNNNNRSNNNEFRNSNAAEPSSNRKRRQNTSLKQKNLYSILGASPRMTKQELKRIYINLAKETHPDSVGYYPESIDRFNEVARAWSILSDPKSRRKHDRELAADAIKDDIVDSVREAGKKYGPRAQRFYDESVIPFLRSIATTFAGIKLRTEERREATRFAEFEVGNDEVMTALRALFILLLLHLLQNQFLALMLSGKS